MKKDKAILFDSRRKRNIFVKWNLSKQKLAFHQSHVATADWGEEWGWREGRERSKKKKKLRETEVPTDYSLWGEDDKACKRIADKLQSLRSEDVERKARKNYVKPRFWHICLFVDDSEWPKNCMKTKCRQVTVTDSLRMVSREAHSRFFDLSR